MTITPPACVFPLPSAPPNMYKKATITAATQDGRDVLGEIKEKETNFDKEYDSSSSDNTKSMSQSVSASSIGILFGVTFKF